MLAVRIKDNRLSMLLLWGEAMSQELIKRFEKKLKPKPYYQSHGARHVSNDLITACPKCHKIIKGLGSMRVHYRWKHLPKWYERVYCIRDKRRMGYYPNRSGFFCPCSGCLLHTNKDGTVQLPLYIDKKRSWVKIGYSKSRAKRGCAGGTIKT